MSLFSGGAGGAGGRIWRLWVAINTARVQVGASSAKGTSLMTREGAKAQCQPTNQDNNKLIPRSRASSGGEMKPSENKGNKKSCAASATMAMKRATQSRRL